MNVTVALTATLATFSSMAASTRRILRTSRTSSLRRTLPCVPSWSAGTFPSTVECLPGTESSKDFLLMSLAAATGRAATTLLQAELGAITRAIAGGLAITLVAVPPPRSSRGSHIIQWNIGPSPRESPPEERRSPCPDSTELWRYISSSSFFLLSVLRFERRWPRWRE